MGDIKVEGLAVKNASPKPEKVQQFQTYNFPDAVRLVLIGKRLSRLDWGDKEEYMYYDEKVSEYLILHTLGQDKQFLLRGVDMDATDWFEVEEETSE